MKNIYFLLSFILLFNVCPVKSQQITFKKNYGYLDKECGYYIEQTMDGGYILCGYLNDGSYSEKCYIIKIDSLSNTEWSKVIAPPDTEINCNYQGLYIHQFDTASYILFIGKNDKDGLLIKLNEQGDTLWSKLYKNIDGNSFQTLDKGYLIYGNCKSGRYLF